MDRQIDLFWLGMTQPPIWPLGMVYRIQDPTPAVLAAEVRVRLPGSGADAWLFWGEEIGVPDPSRIRDALDRPGDLWHSGLRLGMGGQPGIVDFTHPTWMLNRDPDPGVEATSWRLSLRACLVRTEVLRKMEGPPPHLQTLEAAAQEMGHRYVTRGVLMRHLPWLIGKQAYSCRPVALPLEDEFRFAYYRFGGFWSTWALGRMLWTGYAPRLHSLASWHAAKAGRRPADPPPLRQASPCPAPVVTGSLRVSVVIPTLERYPYLHVLLEQLREQTIAPCDIIVVDQSPPATRDTTLAAEFADLPLKILYREQPGQCSSRNDAIRFARGDYILFIDDDDEVGPTLIEEHVQNLLSHRADVSSGVVEETGAGPLPANFRLMRASDVFPTNNTLLRKDVLSKSGLFDLAYERGQRADGDLGMRVYLSGALMVLHPGISLLHHHAAQGGLRVHKARVITYASSRSRLSHRHLPSATEIYMARRYFTEAQVREMLWRRVIGTLRLRGAAAHRMAKSIFGLLALPDTIWKVHRQYHESTRMLQAYPQITELKSFTETGSETTDKLAVG